MVANDKNKSIELKLLKPIPTTKGFPGTKEAIVTSVSKALLGFGFNDSVENAVTDVTYFEGGTELDESEPANAQFAKVTFVPRISAGTVFSSATQPSVLEVLVTSKFEIVQLTYENAQFNIKQDQSYPLLTTTDITTAISNKNFEIVTVFADKVDGSFSDKLETFDVETVSIVYRYNSDQTRILPYFSLSGNARTDYGAPYKAVLITPAIKI